MAEDSAKQVFFDGSCPICRAEIEELKGADQSGSISFVDCSAEGFAPAPGDPSHPSQKALLNALHVFENGHWLSGPDAFAEIYRSLGMTRLAKVWGSRRLRPLVNIVYRLFVVSRPLLAWLGVGTLVRWMVRKEVQRGR